MLDTIGYLIGTWIFIGIGYLIHSFIIFEWAIWSSFIIRVIAVISLFVALVLRLMLGPIVQEGGLV